MVGCARPAYVVRSDAKEGYIRGHIVQVRETYIDNPADVYALPDSLGPYDTYTIIDYNHAGNIIRHNSFAGPDSVHTIKEEYLYDTTGNRMERTISYNPAKQSYDTTIYIYDEQGRLVRHTDEIWGWHVDYLYDRHGYLKMQVDTTYNRERPLITRYRYNGRGLLKTTKSKTGKRIEKHSYHPNGTIAEIRLRKTEIFRYNERGNLIEAISYITSRKPSGRITDKWPATITAEYEYDAHGNWVRRMQFYQGQIVGMSLREIIYYDECQ